MEETHVDNISIFGLSIVDYGGLVLLRAITRGVYRCIWCYPRGTNSFPGGVFLFYSILFFLSFSFIFSFLLSFPFLFFSSFLSFLSFFFSTLFFFFSFKKIRPFFGVVFAFPP